MLFGTMRRLRPIAWVALPAALLLPAPAMAQTELSSAIAAPTIQTPNIDQPLAGTSIRTRFLIGLDKSVVFQVFNLSNPNRIIVELPEVQLQLPEAIAGASVGLVKGFRGGLAAPGKSRVVIDVTEPVVVESAKIEKAKDGKSHRLALQIVPAVEPSREAAGDRKPLKAQPYALGGAGLIPMARPAQRPSVQAARAFKPIIVLDPGHGGHDSGAMKNGAVEKNVVLEFGKELRDKLEKSGRFKVLMTRDDDRFIELSERVDYAERNKANLFIAIHCDYASTKARGATIYSLREGTAESLKKSASREVSANVLSSDDLEKIKQTGDESDVSAVRSILADFAQREVDTTRERTSVFTRAVVETMSETTTMRDDPDQTAGFRVLKTAKFPSVLIELAYVTNKEDAENLMSDAWRDKVSDSILTAIDNYFSNQAVRLPM